MLKDEYRTETEAAKQFGVVRQTIVDWREKGYLPNAIQIGRRWLHKQSDLDALKAKRKAHKKLQTISEPELAERLKMHKETAARYRRSRKDWPQHVLAYRPSGRPEVRYLVGSVKKWEKMQRK